MSIYREPVFNWYENKGRILISQHIDNAYKLDQQYKNDIPQNCGVYMITFNKKPVYIGQSNNVYYRVLEHLYNIFEQKTEWGIKPSHVATSQIIIDFEILHSNITDEEGRENLESEEINKRKPLLQADDPATYPKDKNFKDKITNEWLAREDIASDICVKPYIRKRRIRETFGIDNE